MSANYKLVRNPNPNPEESGKSLPLHPRLVSCGTIHTGEFINRAKSRSSFSPADMKGIFPRHDGRLPHVRLQRGARGDRYFQRLPEKPARDGKE